MNSLTPLPSLCFSSRVQSSSPPITVHYLSPLVLRKELENIIETPDSNANDLYKIDFKEKHSILFWNLVKYNSNTFEFLECCFLFI